MKKITLLFLLTLFCSNAQEVLNEDFEGGIPLTWANQNDSTDPTALATSVWTTNNVGDAIGFTAGNGYLYSLTNILGVYAEFNSDVYGGGAEDVSLTSPAIDCSSLTTVKLSYDHFFKDGYGGNGYVEVSNDGGIWTTVATYTTTANGYTFGAEIIDVSTQLAGSSTAYVRFRWTGDFSWGWSLDNVIVQQPQGNAPDMVTDMLPVDGATDVEIMLSTTGVKMVDFNFTPATTGDVATSYNISIGTDTAGTSWGEVTDIPANVDITYGSTDEVGWQPSTTYYWFITAVNAAGSTASNVQSFTTSATNPLGVEDYVAKVFKAFPNPVSDMLTIQGNLPIEQVEVFNQLGQSILTVKENTLQNNQIDLSRLNAGIYFVEITSDTKTETLRVVKK